jgi:hypothetical protein
MHYQQNDFESRLRRRFLPCRALLCFVAILIAATSHAAKFTVSLDRDTIVLGETATLKLEFDGINPGGMPQLPPIAGLQIAGGLTSGSSSTIGPDGQQSITWFSVPLAASQPGEYAIPPLQIEVGGQRFSSAALTLKVLREDPTAPPAEFELKSAFLWLTLPKTEGYVGETMVPEIRLYVRAGVRNITPFTPPQLEGDGFTSSKTWNAGGQMQRRVGRRMFVVLPWKCSLTPIKSGPIKINPLNSTVVLNPPDVFEGFFGRRGDTEQVAVTTDGREIRSLPLPTENVPPGFNGAVGNYSMNVNVGPTNVATGDPITVRVEISGRGPIESLTLPPQDAWKNFKAYPPTANVEVADQLGIQGRKTFEQIISPESTELREIPTFAFSFFDPNAKQYRTLTHPPVAIIVRPGGSAPAPVIANRIQTPELPAASQDIVHIKPRLGTLRSVSPPLVQRPWFIAANCAPVLAWLLAIGWRKRADALANNPRLRRQRQVAQIVRDGLAELRQHAAANESDKFFATILRLLQEQLGERLDCPASAITEAVIDEKLRPRRIPEQTLNQLHDLFQIHNLARYAPMQSSRELNAVIPRVESALAKIQEVKP